MNTTECCGVCPPRPEVWGRRVLMVNPDLAKAYLMLFELEAAGAEVIVVENATQALAVSASFNPDVLLSRVSLSDDDNHALLDNLKTQLATQGRKFLSVSILPFSWVAEQNHTIKERFQHYIIESLNPLSIIDQVKFLIRSECSSLG